MPRSKRSAGTSAVPSPSHRAAGTRPRASRVAGPLAVLLLCAGTCAALAWILASRLPAARTLLRVEDAVELLVTGAGALGALWLAGSCAVAAACVAARAVGRTWRRGESLVHRCAPVVVRRFVAVAVGTGLGLGALAPGALAAPATAPRPVVGSEAASVVGSVVGSPIPAEAPALAATSATDDTAGLDLGWAPVAVGATEEPAVPVASGAADEPAIPVIASPGEAGAAVPFGASPVPHGAPGSGTLDPTAAPGGADAATTRSSEPQGAGADAIVTVRAGDTLWAIAASHLGDGADDAAVAAAWPDWFDANRDVIGDDPDLLLPGQVLRVPDGVRA